MTIQIELNPVIMKRLAAEAAAHGIALDEYAERLLREALAKHAEPQGQLSVAELHAMLKAIAEGSEKLPKLPTSAFTRDSFYRKIASCFCSPTHNNALDGIMLYTA